MNIIAGFVKNGAVVPSTPLPDGAQVDIHLNGAPTDTIGPTRLRGVPAEQVRGIAAGDGSPPDDETVKQRIHERRVEKYE
jgi:hypothetical protein